jgi:biopolymer transport protein ExbB
MMAWLSYFIDYGIIGLLILLSVISLEIFVERWIFLRRFDPGCYEGTGHTLEIVVTRKLGIIASIGSNAPYIGLLGTYPALC